MRARRARRALACVAALVACAARCVNGIRLERDDVPPARGRSVAEALEADWTRARAFERVLRHPGNDLDPSASACGGTVTAACGGVREARARAAEAERRARREEAREARARRVREKGGGKLKADGVDVGSDGGRTLLATSRGGRGVGGRSSRTARATPELARGRADEEEKRAAEAEEAAAIARAKEEATFNALKSFPKGTLARDPNALEEEMKSVELKLERDPNNEAFKRRLAQLEAEKKKMVHAAGDLGFGGHGMTGGTVTNDERAEDHWFMEGEQSTYRRRRQSRVISARDEYEYIMKKIPVYAKSYYDCVEQILVVENRAALMDFMEYRGQVKKKASIVPKECVEEIKTSKRRIYEFWQAEKDVVKACEEEVTQHCVKVESGAGLITSCLWEANKEPSKSLRPACAASLNAINLASERADNSTLATEENKDDVKKSVVVEEKVAEKVERTPAQETLQEPEKVVRRNRFARADVSGDEPPKEAGSEPVKGDATEHKKVREANAKLKLAEDAEAHASAQSRNLIAFIMFAGFAYVASRKGMRKRITNAVRKLRRETKGDHLG